jgi:eukaryotic-like serine/threonine-protein kinase
MAEPTDPADDAASTHDGGDEDSLLKAILGATACPPPLTLAGGEVLDDTYRIVRRLGAGGMGVVYLARDLRLDRDVAIKLHPTPAGEAGADRLLREARTMAQLVHPNIATIHEVGTWKQHPFVAIEYVDGGTARSWALAKRRAPREIVGLYLAAGRGLAAAHEAGVVHRDFKPDNVLVGTDGRIRVADFGIARAYAAPIPSDGAAPETLTAPGAQVGTPAYMAPEQRDSAAVGPAADQYAFAVSLWEALAGTRPPAGTVPRELAAPLGRALADDPAARWPSMDALLGALERALAAPRRRRLAALVTIGAALAGGAGYLAFPAGEARPDPCRGAGDEIAEAWTADHRAAMAAAFTATDRPFAATAAARSAGRLDLYTRDWRNARLEVCRAALVRRELAPTQHDAQVRCLDRRRAGVAALVATFAADVTPTLVDRSVGLAHALPPVADCADPTRLAAETALPADPARRAELEAVAGAVTEAHAALQAGRYEESLAIVRDAIARAEALGALRTAAEARLVLANLVARDDPAAGRAELERVAFLAAEAGDDYLHAQAWGNLVQFLTIRLRDLDEAERFLPVLEAAIARTSPASRRQLDPGAIIGALRLAQGRPADAAAALERNLAMREEAYGPDDPRVALVLTRLAGAYEDTGRVDDARAAFARAERLYLAAYGADHPDVGMVRNNWALLLMNQGDLEAARAMFVELIASRERLLGAEHVALQMPLSNLGLVLARLGRADESLAHRERALAIGLATRGADHPDVARDQVYVADLIAPTDPARARALLEAALATYEKAQGPNGRWVGTTLVSLAVLDHAAGERARARKHLLRARDIGARYPDYDDAAVAERKLAELFPK